MKVSECSAEYTGWNEIMQNLYKIMKIVTELSPLFSVERKPQ